MEKKQSDEETFFLSKRGGKRKQVYSFSPNVIINSASRFKTSNTSNLIKDIF